MAPVTFAPSGLKPNMKDAPKAGVGGAYGGAEGAAWG